MGTESDSVQHGRAGRAPRWQSVLVRTWRRSIEDRLTTAASSVAFYVLLGSIPGLAAVVLLYGLLADASDVERLSQMISSFVPEDIAGLLDRQIRRIVGGESESGRSLPASIAWIAFVLWSANRGMRGIVDALNTVYDRAEERSVFIRLMVTLAMTVGLTVFIALAIFAVVLLPVVLKLLSVEMSTATKFTLLRWPALLVVATGVTALLLRFGPNRKDAFAPFILAGSVVSAMLWLTMSAAFSLYAQNLASFSALYGSLGSVAAYMIWLWLSALAVLIGAELDAALTARRLEQNLTGKQAED